MKRELFVDRSIKGAVIPTRNWLVKPPLKPSIQLKAFRIPITQKIVNKTPKAGLSSIEPKPNKFPKLSVVLNGVGNSSSYGYKYGYQYGYKYSYNYGYGYGYD